MLASLLKSCLPVYPFFYYGCKEFWNLIYTVRLHGFLVFVLISYINTVFLYRLTCFYLMCYHLLCCLLSPAWYHSALMLLPDMLLLDTCPYYDITYHLSSASCYINAWPVIITFTKIMYQLSCITYTVTIIYSTHVLRLYMYSCTFEFLIMSCSCYSRKLIITL